MSFRTIAVHVGADRRGAVRIDLAARLAVQQGAHLVGIAPTGLPDVIVAMNSAAPDGVEFIALSAAHLRSQAKAAIVDYEARCRAHALPECASRLVVDEPIDGMVGHGRCTDLMVVSQTDIGAPVEGVAADFPQQVLLHAGPPLLLVPRTGAFPTLGRRIVVAWKDTREAARAMRDALPLLERAEKVWLVAVGDVPALPGETEGYEAAAAWLRSHGLVFQAHREVAMASVGEQLLARSAQLGADLIVSGGYGHSRLHEWVLGGVTRHLLQHAPVPVLLSH